MSETIKITILGAVSVGKSCLINQFVTNDFVTDYDPTIEDTWIKHVTCDGAVSKVEMLDTAGSELFSESNFESWVEDADTFILVYDITSAPTFNELEKIHKNILTYKECQNDTYPIIVVGNKKDLEANRQVKNEQGENKAKEWECKFLETSAKTRENVDQMIHTCIREVRNKKPVGGKGAKGGANQKKKFCTLL